MVLYVRVPLDKAEAMKLLLHEQRAFAKGYPYFKENNEILYPVLDSALALNLPYHVEEKDIAPERNTLHLKEALAGVLSPQELASLKSSYDTVGTIAVLEIDETLRDKEKIIADALLNNNKQIKTVVAKEGIHSGEFRLQQHRHLAGEPTTLTLHKENASSIYVDIDATYFSPRLSTERKRIAGMIKPGENILVMFSGCAPYPCVLSRLSHAQQIVGIEKNPAGHELGLKNVKKNKLKNVELYCGDVRDIIPTLGSFDRIIMPLPKSAEDFLDVAIPALRSGGFLHFYDFMHEELFDEAKTKINKACIALGRQADFRAVVRCGQHAPRVYRICVDVVIY